MMVLAVLIFGIAAASVALGINIGRKQGREEGKELARKSVVARAKKFGYDVPKLYRELLIEE